MSALGHQRTKRHLGAMSALPPKADKRADKLGCPLCAMDLGIADDSQRARREQAAQIAISLFADTAELVLAPARALLRIDHRGLLANEQMAGAMEHQAALLLRGLGRDEPHVCS